MSKFKVQLAICAILLLASNASRADDLRGLLFAAEGDSARLQIANQIRRPDARLTTPTNPLSESAPTSSSSMREFSAGGAMMRSLLIPGWGESYLGYHGTARAFFWTDVALLSCALGWEVYSQWKEDQFIAFAAAHSGALMSGKDDQFYADIGNYPSVEAYLEAKLRNRDYEAIEEYSDAAFYWSWDYDQNRLDYDHLRIQSRSAHNKVYLFLGAAALNRLISLVDTGKKARDLMKQSTTVSWQFQPEVEGNGARVVVTANLHP